VSVAKEGYVFNPTSKSVTVYYVGAPTPLSFLDLAQDGSDWKTTSMLTLTFSEDIAGLTADHLTLESSTGAAKGSLARIGTGVYELALRSSVSSGGSVRVGVSKTGYTVSPSYRDITVYFYADPVAAIPVNYETLSANGTSGTVTTTMLTLQFNRDIAGLDAADLALRANGTGANAESLSRTGFGIYRLSVSGISAAGSVSVGVSKGGYEFDPTSLSVPVYYAAPAVSVSFDSLSANGSAGTATTTKLTLNFDKDITGLGTGDISLSPSITKTSLNKLAGTGVYELIVDNSGAKVNAYVNVSVTRTSYTISGSPKSVRVYYVAPPTPVTFSDLTANGTAGSVTTTQLTLTFSENIPDLAVGNIEFYSGITGAGKGNLTGGPKVYTLGVSGISASGQVQVTVTKGGYTITPLLGKTVTVHYNTTPFVDDLVGSGSILIGKAEVSTGFYETVKAWAKTNKAYSFIYSANQEHTVQANGQAVGGITFYEAVVWCNALTEYYNDKHGLTGASALIPYYQGVTSSSNSARITARNVVLFDHYSTNGLLGEVWVATTVGKLGFRLPIQSEWTAGKANYLKTGFDTDPYDWTFTRGGFSGSEYRYNTGNPVTGVLREAFVGVDSTMPKENSFRIAIDKSSLQ
jgi:hypothetical protein